MANEGRTFEEVQQQIRAFMSARDWEQFHTPKNLAMALAGEAAEILEIFQWMTPEQSRSVPADATLQATVADEIADVAVYLTVLADAVGVDIPEAVASKMDRNEERFPTGESAEALRNPFSAPEQSEHDDRTPVRPEA